MDLFGLPLSLLMGFVCFFILFVCISFVEIQSGNDLEHSKYCGNVFENVLCCCGVLSFL